MNNNKGKNTFIIPLSPNEPRPVLPYRIIVPLLGGEARLATIKLGPTQVTEEGSWYAEATILKGKALSEEYWNDNMKKIRDYICSKLTRFASEP